MVDDLTDAQLGAYDLAPVGRRFARLMLLDRSVSGLVSTIVEAVQRLEPLASYLPTPVLNLLVENAAQRQLAPDFPTPTVVFVNLLGLPEAVDRAALGEEANLMASFSLVFALINAAVEARGGVLKKVTYHLAGSDMVIYFGVPNAHTDDPRRAADAALAIRNIITHLPPPTVGSAPVTVACQIGLACGRAFAAEVGQPRGQREFNVIGDAVNTAAHLMNYAAANQILLTETVSQAVVQYFDCEPLGLLVLKGKDTPTPVLALRGPLPGPGWP